MAGDKGVKLSEAIMAELEQLDEGARRALDKAAKNAARDGVKFLKEKSPKDKGNYAKSWTRTKGDTVVGVQTYVIHNRKHYRLTHLLEHGHHIVYPQGDRPPGAPERTRPQPHIEPARQYIRERYPNEVRRMIEVEVGDHKGRTWRIKVGGDG